MSCPHPHRICDTGELWEHLIVTTCYHCHWSITLMSEEKWKMKCISMPPFAYHDLTERHALLKPCHVLKSCKFWLNNKQGSGDASCRPTSSKAVRRSISSYGWKPGTLQCNKRLSQRTMSSWNSRSLFIQNLETTASLCMNRTVPKPTVTESGRTKAIACCQESPADSSTNSGFVEDSAASNSSLRGTTKKSFSLGTPGVSLSSLCVQFWLSCRIRPTWAQGAAKVRGPTAIAEKSHHVSLSTLNTSKGLPMQIHDEHKNK